MKINKKGYDNYIQDHITVDCYDDYEKKMGWYYYLQDELDFPFIAYMPVKMKNQRSNTLISSEIEIIGLLGEDFIYRYNDIMVEAELGEYIMNFPLSEIKNIKSSPENIAIISLWKYWFEKQY